MYSSHSRDAIIEQKQTEAVAAALIEEQRKAYWAEQLGMNNQNVQSTQSSQSAYNQAPAQQQTSGSSEYYSEQSPYSERLAALSMNDSEYERPSSYYDLQRSGDATLSTMAKYDPAKYDARMDQNGTIIVEPKYVSSMYGAWGDPYYPSYSWYRGFPSWSYSSSWGYPRYSWWDYNYNFSFGFGYSPYYYDSWWGYPYGWNRPYYRPHYRPHYRPNYRPNYRPSYRPTRPSSIVRRPSQSAPSSSIGRRNSDGSTVGRSSGSSYNRGSSSNRGSSYNRGSSSSSRNNTPTRPSTRTRTQTNIRSNSNYNQFSAPTRSPSSFGGSMGGGVSRPSMPSGGAVGGTNRLGR